MKIVKRTKRPREVQLANGSLPKGWRIVRFGDVAESRLGKMLDKQKNKGKPQPYLRNPNVQWFHIDLNVVQEMPFEDDEDDKYGLKEGDVVICEGGEAGRAAIWDGSVPGMKIQKAIHRVRTGKDLHNRYLVYQLMADYDDGRLADYYTGTTIKHLTGKNLDCYEFLLPPLSEQKRIAGILDAADALRGKRRESLAQLDTLLQSSFLDMFGDPVTNPMGWEECTVGDVVHSAKDGPHVSPKYSDSGIPFLSTRHIKPSEVVWEDLKFIDQSEADRQWRKCKPEFGDILYTKGGTTGIAARVTTSEPFAVWVHVALLKPIAEKVDPAWLEGMLNSAYCYTQSQRYTHGIANRDLGLKRMVKIKIYHPSLNLQRRFAAIVESVEGQKARQRSYLCELDNLFASLQSRAFNGEL